MSIETPATHELSWTWLLQQLAARIAIDPAIAARGIRTWRQEAMVLGRTIGSYYQVALHLAFPCSHAELRAALAALQRDLDIHLTIQHDDANGMTLVMDECPWEALAHETPVLCDMMRCILCATVAWLTGYARAPFGKTPAAVVGHCHFYLALRPDEVPEAELAGQFTRREMEEVTETLGHAPLAAPNSARPDEAIYERLYHQQVALTGKLEHSLGLEQAEMEQLRSFTRLKQDFLSNVSHEFRTPITAMQGYLTLLQQEAFGPLNGDQQDALQTTSRNLDRLKRLVNDVLDYSSLTHGKLAMQEEHVEITDILTRAMQLAHEPASAQQVTIRSDIHPPVGQILGDRDKLVQIVAHLLENAVKFSEPGSEIVLRGQRRQHHAEITVQDRGIGMSPGQLQTVFVPFVQGDSGLSRRFGGLGMGLSLIRHLVMLHGGNIHINSAVGEGTTVTVALPLHE